LIRLPRSIQLRTLLAASVTLAVFLTVFTLALLESFSTTQQHAIMRRLAADANTLITAAHEENGRLIMPEQLANERFNLADSDLIGMIYSSEGELLWQSRSSADRLPDYDPTYRHDTLDFSRTSYRGEEYFVYDLDLTLGDAPGARGYSFITMDSAEEYHLLMAQFRRQLVLWVSASCAVLLLFLGVALRWSFGPLRALRSELQQVETGSRELLSEHYPSEIIRLTRSLNRLLSTERVQQQRYRGLMSDLAHSLKTPLANFHNTLLRLRKTSRHDRDALRALEEQVHEMNQIISFQLQRGVPGQSVLAKDRVPVQRTLKKLVASLHKVYRDKPVHCTIDVPPELVFRGNRQAFMEIFGNVLDNAFRLCVQRVAIRGLSRPGIRNGPGSLIIEVEDDGPGIPLERRAAVLQRGVRADRRHPGQGIGLAVVQDILKQYEGQLSISESTLGGARFIIRIAH